MGDRYRLVLNAAWGSVTGIQIKNVFYYETDTSSDPSALELATQFESVVMPALCAVTSPFVYYIGADAVNLDNPADFGNNAFVEPHLQGTVSGDPLPPFVAFEFRYNRTVYGVRNGWKRFAGVSESQQAGGDVTVAAHNALVTLATALKTDIEGAFDSYRPRYATRPLPGHPISDTVLRTPGDIVYVRITTQNTRKPGRGA